MELRTVGQTITAMFNGEVVGQITDGTFAEGIFDVQFQEHSATKSKIKALEVLNLDTPVKPGAAVEPGATPLDKPAAGNSTGVPPSPKP